MSNIAEDLQFHFRSRSWEQIICDPTLLNETEAVSASMMQAAHTLIFPSMYNIIYDGL